MLRRDEILYKNLSSLSRAGRRDSSARPLKRRSLSVRSRHLFKSHLVFLRQSEQNFGGAGALRE